MNVKKILVITLFINVSGTAVHAQSDNVKFLIDTTITIMKKNAVNADTVDWTAIKNTAFTMAKNINDPYQLGPTMRYLYQAIGDFHGTFFYKDSSFQWKRENKPVPDSFMNEWKKGVQSVTMVLDKNIGYIRIPSMPVANQEEFNTKAQKLNDSLCSLLSKNVKGIILDLRLNGGGAMHPMICGLTQLLTPGKLGSFHTNTTEEWILKNNGFYIDTALISKINPICNVDGKNFPVVMLVSPFTGSSAECLIIAFKGRKNTVLLGSKSAGYVTVNNGFQINDTAFMNLAVGYSSDRSGKIYKDAIDPDLPVTGIDKFNDVASDEKVVAAVKWLKKRIK